MRCERCLYPLRTCLCAAIPSPPLASQTRVVIVRHYFERYRASNTGRLAQLALANCAIVDHGAREDGPTELPDLAGAWLVFPAGEPVTTRPAEPPRQIVVLDASWSQARRMYRKLDALRGLRPFALPIAPMPSERLRASPGPGQVSTIEAVARALRIVEPEGDGERIASALERLFATAVVHAHASGRW